MEKLDKNESACSLALTFGRFSCFLALGGGGEGATASPYPPLAMDLVWIDGILYKLFCELGIGGRMLKVIKHLYTNVKAQVLYAGSLSRKIDVSLGKVEFLRHLCAKYMSMGFYVC